MKRGILLISFLVLGCAFAQNEIAVSYPSSAGVGVTSVGVPGKVIGVDYRNEMCNASPAFIDAIKGSMIQEYSLADYTFSNLTNEYCYNYSGYKSISLNFIFKKSESDYQARTVSASFYISDTVDFSVLFNDKENNAIDYTLKYKYLNYTVNGTDEEYFVSLSPVYTESGNGCAALRTFYDSLSGEKYFNEEGTYCSIILKTRTSQVKNLVNDAVSYVSFFGDKVRFYFSGYSKGSYDLAALSNSINCSLSKADYYYPIDNFECYGIYKDRTRVYFGVSKNLGNDTDYMGVSLSVYGYLNGKAKITVNAYGNNVNVDDVIAFASENLIKYFDGSYTISVKSTGYGFEGSLIIDSLVLKTDALSGLNISMSMMDTNYWSDNVYVTVSEPYIQVFVPETPSEAQSSIIRPIYWGRNLVITSSMVYSSVTLDVNDNGLAVANIREFTSPYVTTSDWVLNMSVTGGYYYPLVYTKTNGVAVPESVSSSTSSGSVAVQSVGVRDSLTASNSVADFALLDAPAPTVFELIVGFFKGLFGLQ